LRVAPGGVTAATPRLIASIAEGERAGALAKFVRDSGGEKSFGCASGVEQPVNTEMSEIRRAAR
jgi:hypothetical protein